MLKLLPTANLDGALAAIQTAESGISFVRSASTPVDAFNAYNTWAIRQAQGLHGIVLPSEIDRLITTARYWSLQTTGPGDHGAGLRETISWEMDQRVAAFEVARREVLEASERLRHGEAVAIVLDTNVLLRHPEDWLQMGWHEISDERPHVRMDLIITIEVIEELDDLKLSRGEMDFRDRPPVLRRTLARRALKTLRSLFLSPTSRPEHIVAGIPARVTRAELHVEPRAPTMARPQVDTSLIDTTLALTPFWHRARLATFDDALVFRATAAGTEAIRLDDGLVSSA